MARLPVEGYYDPMGNPTGLPVEQPAAVPPVQMPTQTSSMVDQIVNKLFRDDEKRYQLWPEKLVRDAIGGANDFVTGKIPMYEIVDGELRPSMASIKTALDMSALAGTGGLGGAGVRAGEAALGATPFLRPALKYKDKIYKGKPGQEHLDVLPPELVPEFQRLAMSGEDISHYNFGFLNHKGHFLDREAALKYAIDEGLMSPHDAKFGALTSTMMADSSKPAVAAKLAEPFYSALEQTVGKINQNKMTGEQWLGTISNKPGVKPEELDWTGLKSYLEQNKGQSLTKEQIEAHLKDNAVKVQDNWKGGITKRDDVVPDQVSQDKYKKEWDDTVKQIQELRPKVDDFERKLSASEWQKASDEHAALVKKLDDIHEKSVNDTIERMGGLGQPTKYHSYQLPGGENYRELLMTLPEKTNKNLIRRDEIENRLSAIQDDFDNIARQPDSAKLSEQRFALAQEKATLYNELKQLHTSGESPNYKSSHWDEPNIVAHVRMNDRTIGNKKSLHLEEIQSDWHQQGRDKGYKSFGDLNKFNELDKAAELARTELSFEAERTAKEAIGSSYAKFLQSNPSQAERLAAQEKIAEVRKNDKAYLDASDKVQEVIRQRDSYNPVSKVPDAPFKKNWHELALKRAIREAAEKGYDRLSWTPGEAQAARYDLSKQLKELQYLKNEDGTYSIAGVTKDGGGFNHPDNVPASKLPDIVGKEMAEKIIKNEGKRARGHPANGGYFEGVDLKIGGEGMKGFYDQIIPKAVEKLTGQKVQKGYSGPQYYSIHEQPNGKYTIKQTEDGKSFNVGTNKTKKEAEDWVAKNEPHDKVHYIDITPELKEKAMQGFPLFSDSSAPAWIVRNGELQREE